MSTLAILIGTLPFVRSKTYDFDGTHRKTAGPRCSVGLAAGSGPRAHRLAVDAHCDHRRNLRYRAFPPEKERSYEDIWPRYRGGSVPDDHLPKLPAIRMTLETTRLHLLDTLHRFSDADLAKIPAGLTQRGLTLQQAIELIAWHEGHHHGQAHLTLNLFKAAHGIA